MIANEVQKRIETGLSQKNDEFEYTAKIEEDNSPGVTLSLSIFLKKRHDKKGGEEKIAFIEVALGNNGSAEIKELGVTGPLRGIGIGSVILRYVHDILREKGCKSVIAIPSSYSFKDRGLQGFFVGRCTSETTPDNRVSFYEKNGYIKQGGGSSLDITMSRQL